jgi:hypothetical protein
MDDTDFKSEANSTHNNILAIFLCLSQNTSYFVYYVCMLHSAYFLMVYLIMVVGSGVPTIVANTKLMPTAPISLDQHLSLNYSKYGLRLKLMLGGLLIYIVWDTNLGAFQLLHFPFLTYARLWKGHLLDQCGSGISGPVFITG